MEHGAIWCNLPLKLISRKPGHAMAAIIKSPQKLESDVFMVSGYDGEQEAFAFDKTELSLSQIRNR